MRALLICALLTAAAAPVAAQTVFRSGVEVVELDVSVMRGSVPVAGLTADNFIVTDNGLLQQVRSATLNQLPLTVTLLLDVSQSVSGARLENLMRAGDTTTRALRAGDRASLITFSHLVRQRVALTDDMAQLRLAVSQLAGGGATALRDAVYLAIAARPEARRRSLLLLFSDGADTASWLTEERVVDSVRRAGAVIHSVRFGDDRFLDRLAEESGGRTWSATSDRQLQELFTGALDEMRSRYVLTYEPAGEPRPGWHEIRVRLRNARGEVTARPGYVVPDTAPDPGETQPPVRW